MAEANSLDVGVSSPMSSGQLLSLVRRLHEENTILWRELETSSRYLGATEKRTLDMQDAIASVSVSSTSSIAKG